MFRFPVETASAMASFYDEGYSEPGLTTDLPSSVELEALLACGFQGSGKDFSHQIALMKALGLKPGMRVLDYGANWGYATWQFRRAGFDVDGFEISQPRAAFAAKLGVHVETTLNAADESYEAVFSSHVLEHVPNPQQMLQDQLRMTKRGGLVIAHTPNGSRARLSADASGFHRHWGQVHPVLLTDLFVHHVAGEQPFYATSMESVMGLAAWDRESQVVGDLTGPNLYFVIVRK